MIINQKTMKDIIKGLFYKVRFWVYRKFLSDKLYGSSEEEKSGWELTFSDYFKTNSWSDSKNTKWRTRANWGEIHYNKPSVHYGPPELLSDDVAKFTVKYNPKSFMIKGEETISPYEVSFLTSTNSFNQQYGRFECRMTIPHDMGGWPAFWMWGSTWPPEIDVLEMYGGCDCKKAGEQKITLHYGNTEKTMNSRGWGVMIESENDQRKFHEFVCEWTPTKISFITDGNI